MKTFESSFQAIDGVDLHVRGWEPDGKAQSVVALVHGLGEHTGRYVPMGQGFTRAGFALVGFDLRGHGLSGGRRGHTPSYEALMDDIASLLDTIRARYSGLPVFLYGHSLGGNLVLNFALRRAPELRGVIASAPWLKLALRVPGWRVMIARVMDRIAPAFLESSGLESAGLSHDASVVDAYDRDPLVHDRISPRLFVGAYDSGFWALEHAAEFPLPLLLMHGTADPVTSVEASREFAGRAGKMSTWHPWEDWFHELHNEPGRPLVLKAILEWMDMRLKKK